MTTMRDIDYAARAVLTAFQQKFGARHDLHTLTVEPRAESIRVAFSGRQLEGTRDSLMIAIRKANVPHDVFEPGEGTSP